MLDGLVIKAVLLYVPIGLMLLGGAWVSLRSGVMAVSTEDTTGQAARIAVENLLRLVLVLVAVAAALLVLQCLVGYHLPWDLGRWFVR